MQKPRTDDTETTVAEARQKAAPLRCPTCGSPAMRKGKHWECGYCGDSGVYSPKQKK